MNDSDDRVFALGEQTWPSLEALNAWFAAQLAGTQSKSEQADLRLAQKIAIHRHLERAVAAANAPMPKPPASPKPPDPLPPDASVEQRVERMYGKPVPKRPVNTPAAAPALDSLDDIERHFGRLRKAAGDDTEKVREIEADWHAALDRLEADRKAALERLAEEDRLAAELYGSPVIGVNLAAARPKRQAQQEDAEGG